MALENMALKKITQVRQRLADIVYERDDLRWSSHCPDAPMDPGEHFWRYSAANAPE